MKITHFILFSVITAALAAPAFARGPGRGNGPCRGTGVCPYGNIPGSGMCAGARAGATRGAVDSARGNPNSTGTPLRDGSGKATAPGHGAKDGTGNNPRHPETSP